MKRKPLVRAMIVTVILVATAAIVLSQAFIASNTVPTSNAGSGSNTVSGYTVSNIDYNLNATGAEDIDSVEFDLSPTNADTAVIKLDAQQYSCTLVAGHATCDTTSPQATVTPVTSLSVIAAD